MPRNNYNLNDGPIGLALGDEGCPKCGTGMEGIDIAVKDLRLRQLRLCPECYLVTWIDDSGFQIRQGVPMKQGQPSEWAGKPN